MPTSARSSTAQSAVAELDQPPAGPPDDVAAQADADQALVAELGAARAELAAICAEKDAAEAARTAADAARTAAEAARAAADNAKRRSFSDTGYNRSSDFSGYNHYCTCCIQRI